MIEVCVLRSKTVMIMACTQKKLIRLRLVVMMIRDYKHLIGLQYFHMELVRLKYVRVK